MRLACFRHGMVVAVLLALGAQVARAEILTLLGDMSLLEKESVAVVADPTGSLPSTPVLKEVWAGGMKLQNTLTTPKGPVVTAVCLDVNGTLSVGTTYDFAVQEFDGQSGLNPAWGSYAPGDDATAAQYYAIQNAAYLFDNFRPAVPTATSTSAEILAMQQDWTELQLAVWSVLYNTTPSGAVGSARFTGSGDRWNAANAMISSAKLPGKTEYSGDLLNPTYKLQDGSWVVATGGQELLVSVTPEIPEPSTMIAAALLLLPFGASAFRVLRKRNAK